MFHSVHMAVMLFDHLDRRAHLLGKDVNIDAFGEAEGRIGMAEAIGRTGNAARPYPQVRFRQQVLHRVAVEILGGFAVDDGENGVVGLSALDSSRTRSR